MTLVLSLIPIIIGNSFDYHYGDAQIPMDEESLELSQEDCWTVITSFFKLNGLVKQQLESFDEFIMTNMQEIVDENSDMTLKTADRHRDDWIRCYKIKFGQIYLSRPSITETDGTTALLTPQHARLRNLTYHSPIYLEMSKSMSLINPDREDNLGKHINEMKSEATEDPMEEERSERVYIGKVPIMLRSQFCHLYGKPANDLFQIDECPYDQGGYFIINGSEKVLIAQERMARNEVYVFAQTGSMAYRAEIRSHQEQGFEKASQLSVRMMAKPNERNFAGRSIRATIPYTKNDVPIVIVFRALGIIPDKKILEHICYDPEDTAMLELLKPCIEEAFLIQTKEIALDYIGKRGKSTAGANREKRVK